MKKTSNNWLLIAERDFKQAKLCLDGEQPLGVIYHLHAAVEKLLKAICTETTGNPPRIHSLKRLAVDVCKITLEKQDSDLIILLDDAYNDSRYPDDVVEFEERYDIERCQELYKNTRETFLCLRNLLTKN